MKLEVEKFKKTLFDKTNVLLQMAVFPEEYKTDIIDEKQKRIKIIDIKKIIEVVRKKLLFM